MSSISAGTSAGTALVSTGDTTGALQLQVNGTTPSVTLAANGSIGVGSTPGYGTSGQVLTSAGTGSAPTWTTPSAAPALIFISSVVASSSATVIIPFAGTYDNYLIVMTNVVPANGGSQFYAFMEVGGTYRTSGYLGYSFRGITNNATPAGEIFSTNIRIGTSLSNAAAGALSGTIEIYNPAGSGAYKNMTFKTIAGTSASQGYFSNGGAFNTLSTASLTNLKFEMDSGNITSGTFRLYGISNS